MTAQNWEIEEAARLWVIRVHDSDFDDWDELTNWLEEDAAHLAVYEAALAEDDWAGELFRVRPLAPPATFHQSEPQRQSRPRKRWYAAGAAIAAAVAGVVTLSLVGLNRPEEIVTAPGEQRTIPLADGSRIILNGGTRITIDRDATREVELAAGEALFEVKHDERNPFVVTVDGTRLVDAGTVFNVISEDGSLDVAVAEGAVIYDPGREEIKLAAGEALSRTGAKAEPVLRKARPQTVGGWQAGQLAYTDAALDQVARDLGRNLGLRIRPVGGAERLRFTGTLAVDGPANEVLKRAGALLGVTFTAEGNNWRMTPANGAPPY